MKVPVEEQYFEKIAGMETDSNLIFDKGGQKEARSLPREQVVSQLLPGLVSEEFVSFLKTNTINENALFLSAFAYTLAKYSGQEEALFCCVRSELQELKILPFHTKIEEDMAPLDYIQHIQEEFMDNTLHNVMDFQKLAKKYEIHFDIMYDYCGQKKECFDSSFETNLFAQIVKREAGYEMVLQYPGELYGEATIRRFADTMNMVLVGFLSANRLCEIELITKEEKEKLQSFTKTEASYDHAKSVIDLFREQAVRTPENVAVIYKDTTLTYRQLDERTERIGQHIQSLGIGKEKVVSVLMNRNENMAVASLGVLKAGAAYQPLDPSYPMERLQFMMEDAKTELLIADENLLSLVPSYQGSVLLTKEFDLLPLENRLLSNPEPEDLFILLYTSGSTGQPKGCMLEHRNLVAFIHWYQAYYHLTSMNKVAAYASYGFDANMMDLYPALTCGAAVVVIGDDIRLDLLALDAYFDEQKITHSFMTTQVGRQMALYTKSKHLKHLSVGGEKLVPIAPPEGLCFYNLYGPTECTVLTTAFLIDKEYENVPIGKALDNIRLYVLDQYNRRMPIGVPGELCISGYQVSRGYLNRPEQTKKVYTKNPYCEDKGYQRMYHTGDVVRFLADGNVEFIGRRDGQVKIRGFRIELTEVEKVIREFPGIKDATVAAFDDTDGGKFLAAYLVSDEPVDTQALARFILENKPPYMVPEVMAAIDKIPLNQNQKVDKRALPKPERQIEKIILPQNEMQQKIYDCIKTVLGHEQFGVTSDIYQSGLTSIGALKLNLILSEHFAIVIKMKDLKDHNTVEKLEKLILDAGEVISYHIQEDYPITQTQSGIFVECIANPGTTMYNLPFLFKLSPQIDVEKLRLAVMAAIDAHPYIKMRLFQNESGEIRAKRRDDEVPLVSVIEKEPDIDGIIQAFNLMKDDLYRITIYRGVENPYIFLDLHHIISDGTSEVIFLRDIERAYGGEKLTKEVYSGFEAALEEERLLKTNVYEAEKEYYDGILKGCDTEYLPSADIHGGKKGLGRVTLEDDCFEEAKQFCDKNHISMNALFLSAFGFLIGAYSYKEDALFATIHNGRSDSRAADAVDMLVKTIPAYCNLDGGQSVEAYCRAMGEQYMEGMSRDLYSYAKICHDYGIKSDIIFAYQGDDFSFDSFLGKETEEIPLHSNMSMAPISMDVFVIKGKLSYQLEYQSDRYSQRKMQNLLDCYKKIVSDFLQKEKLKEVSMVSEEGMKQLEAFNETSVIVENITANVMFERQVEENSQKVAVICNGEQRTFKELNENANRIANSLQKRGLCPEQIVALLMPRTIDVYAVRQGILKAGGAFLSIDPEYPADRISYILEDSKAPFLILPREYQKRFAEMDQTARIQVLILEELLGSSDIKNPVPDITPESLAYCIYTSGSTGKPKGVMIRHRNLINYVTVNQYNIEAKAYAEHVRVSLAFAAITFDVSILEECIMLYNGITVCMATEDEIHNPLLLAKTIQAYQVDAFTGTPSYLMNVVDMKEMMPALKQIKLFNIGAEAFPKALFTKIRNVNQEALILNGYGPTETTIGCTMEVLHDNETITIGRPMANMQMVMVDRYKNVLPIGVPGEMMILGNGVGAGYIGNEEKTKEKFVTLLGRPAYHSGDLAAWNFDGKIEFMGRIDNQVKLRGLRVELDEIEYAINNYDGIKSSVVIVKGGDQEQFLCGYFTADHEVKKEELIAHLHKSLTDYMVPSVLIQLEVLPLTNNGKIDKKALPEPELIKAVRHYKKPVTKLQEKLCAIFAMALGIERIGTEDDFFEMGGTSLSASKVAMKCMTQDLPVVYADIFEHKNVLALETYILSKQESQPKEMRTEKKNQVMGSYADVLSYNTIDHVKEVKGGEIGNILLTGATGFLGIHVLKAYLDEFGGTVYCLIRPGKKETDIRLKAMLVYYFENDYRELFENRIQIVEGDVTDPETVTMLKKYDFDTVINCAACVKHFAADDVLEKVNVESVKLLAYLCLETNRRFIHISTTSSGGDNVNGQIEAGRKFTEQDLDIGQTISNKYVKSKIASEEIVLKAIRKGLSGKICRVGNLMARNSDGEFQVNFKTNGFMRMIKGYVTLGKFPISMMDMEAEFSPIDSTAQAILKLAGTNDKYTVFHPYNSHSLLMADVVDALQRYGYLIEVIEDEEFNEILQKAIMDESINMKVSGLISYMEDNGQNTVLPVEADNSFTTKILFRLRFHWPITNEEYLNRSIEALASLDFFE